MIPRWLRALWAAWTALAHQLADIQARVLLTIFYFVVLGPTALVIRLAARLASRHPERPGWLPRTSPNDPATQARRQF